MSVPCIQRLPRSSLLSDFVKVLERDGCVVVQDFTDMMTLEKASQEVKPWLLDADEGPGTKVGGKSQRPLYGICC